MVLIKPQGLNTYRATTVQVHVPLLRDKKAFFPTADWVMVFMAKNDKLDPDEDSVVQKFTGIGLSYVGRYAVLDIVPDDTELFVTDTILQCVIKGQNTATGDLATLAVFIWRIAVDGVGDVGPSVPIYTTNPPIGGGSGVVTFDSLGELQAFATVGIGVGVIVQAMDEGTLKFYRLLAGVMSTVSPGILRPNDFNSATNAKVWYQVL